MIHFFGISMQFWATYTFTLIKNSDFFFSSMLLTKMRVHKKKKKTNKMHSVAVLAKHPLQHEQDPEQLSNLFLVSLACCFPVIIRLKNGGIGVLASCRQFQLSNGRYQ